MKCIDQVIERLDQRRRHGTTDDDLQNLFAAYRELELRNKLLIRWLDREAELHRELKKTYPHPLDFMLDDDPNAYQKAVDEISFGNTIHEEQASSFEHVIDVILQSEETMEKKFEQKINPSNEFDI